MNFEVRIGKGGWWAILLGLAVAIAIGVAIVLVAASVFIILVPVVAAAAVVLYLLRWFRLRRAPRQDTQGQSRVIEAEYRIVEKEERDPKA